MTLGVYPLRLSFDAGRALELKEGTAANLIRGQFGKILLREYPQAYEKYFAPIQTPDAGPSGFRNPPRPFVLRVAELEGTRIGPGEKFVIGVNLFEVLQPPIDLFAGVLTRVGCQSLGASRLSQLDGTARLDICLNAGLEKITRVRVHFKTPLELKGANAPQFATLFTRIRDRVSLLRSLYGEGPLEIDFRAMGERAGHIAMTRCELRETRTERYSRSQSAAHPMVGFTGVAEYQGELTEFLPYLKAATWTGVGRQTVWGKGEIHLG